MGTDKPSWLSRRVLDRMVRVFLRSLPLLPGPELFDLVLELRRSQNDLDREVQGALEALQDTTKLIERIEHGVAERSERLDQLRQEYERYSMLAKIEADKAEAILQQLEISIGKGRSKERLVAVGINLLVGLAIFILGVAFGDQIKLLLSGIAP
jgi:hypothetical protein